jgi:hypothetical protein
MKTVKDCVAAIEGLRAEIDSLKAKIVELEARPTRGRDYGPKSENAMTAEIAWRIKYGDRTAAKVKDIADEFGLSRGQVYSVRGGYTFTHVKPDDFDIVEHGA